MSGRRQGGKILIIGVGNLLLKDEGVGVHIAQTLLKKEMPAGVEVIDGGVAGIGLLDFMEGASKVFLIDAADMRMEPGAVVRVIPEQVKGENDRPRFSAHDVGVMEVLDLARAMGRSPQEVVIIGIQPKEISWGTELSAEVQAAVPKVIDLIFKEIQEFLATEDPAEKCDAPSAKR